MIDRVDLLASMDRMAIILRRAGLWRLTRVGREVLRKVLADRLRVEWDRLVVMSGIEHRGYLRSLKAGQREAGALSVWRTLLRPRATVVDVGAYLGVFSLVAARIVGRSRVFALEPHPRSLPHLRCYVACQAVRWFVEGRASDGQDHRWSGTRGW